MASAGSSRRQVPFGGHQLAEYALAAALVVVGLHLGGRPAVILAVAGAVIGVFAFISQGRLAALRMIPRRVHVYLDLVLAAGFAASPLLYLHNLQIIPIVLSEAVAVLLVRMSFTTEIVARPRVSKRKLSTGEATASRSATSSGGRGHDGRHDRGPGLRDGSGQSSWIRCATRVAARSLGRADGPGTPPGACRSRRQRSTGRVLSPLQRLLSALPRPAAVEFGGSSGPSRLETLR